MRGRKTARVQIVAFEDDKAIWQEAAQLTGTSLSGWVCSVLNRAAAEEFLAATRRARAREALKPAG